MKNYQPVIGLEIHVELKTEAKMFCQCPASYFGKPPNSQVCPVCLGLPGALPVPNKKAVEWTILLGKALNCQINKISKFDRKHYFYPDLPKGYQISQYDQPIAYKGKFEIPARNASYIEVGGRNSKFEIKKIIRIRRVHLEEDTGKLIHLKEETLIDFNRSGVPLVEIVTEPDFEDSNQVKRFLEELQVMIRYLGISDCDMEKGTMRFEPNISIKDIKYQKSNIKMTNRKLKTAKDKSLPDYKVEIKNINSFRFVKQGIDYEVRRQIELLKTGKTPIQETRGFDEKKQVTYSQRTKEEAADYRYFPEPDIPPMVFDDYLLAKITKQLPELPQEKLERYVNQMGIRYQEAFILTRDKKLSHYFEQVSSEFKIKNSKLQLKIQNYEQKIANFIVNRKISSDLSPEEFVSRALTRLGKKEVDEEKLESSINRIIELNKKAVEDYKKGKLNAIMFLVGQVMKKMGGQANPKVVIEKIKNKI